MRVVGFERSVSGDRCHNPAAIVVDQFVMPMDLVLDNSELGTLDPRHLVSRVELRYRGGENGSGLEIDRLEPPFEIDGSG